MQILYKIKSGSHLYGLNTPTSDIDYVGVYIEDSFAEFINPFKITDELNLSYKLLNGKNDLNAMDEKYYHISKFIKLCSENNPGFLEMLFAPEHCIEYAHPFFKSLIIAHPNMFINIKLIDRFIGYAKGQEQKGYTKANNYFDLENFRKRLISLKSLHVGTQLHEIVSNDQFKCNTEFKISESSAGNRILELGGMKFPLGITIKEAISRIDDRFARSSYRIDNIFINKYDPKFMSHTVRLLEEGYQILTTGRITFPFKGQVLDDIMNIKLGKLSVPTVFNTIDAYKNKFSKMKRCKKLPEQPDYKTIKKAYTELIINIYKNQILKENNHNVDIR